MTLNFDKVNRVIQVALPDEEVIVQQLINAIRDWEDELINMEEDKIADASGKDDLGGGAYVGITLKLVNNWRIQFAPRPGPDWVNCFVKGGNLVAENDYNDDPLKSSPYVNAVIAQSTSPTLVGVDDPWAMELPGGYTGQQAGKIVSDVPTTSEIDSELSAVHGVGSWEGGVPPTVSEIAVGVWEEALSDHAGISGSAAEALQFLTDIEGGRWQIANNQMIFYASDNQTVICRFNLYDAAGQPTMQDIFERRRV